MRTSFILCSALLLGGHCWASQQWLTSTAADTKLGERIQAQLRTDADTRDLLLTVDTYKDLAILHGWVRTPQQRLMVANKVRAMLGVGRVFSYLESDDPSIDDPVRIGRMSDRVRVSDSNTPLPITRDMPPIGLIPPGADPLARRVKVALAADDATGPWVFAINVDTYDGLIVLHGNLPDESLKSRADDIAARMPGVAQVFSYLNPGHEAFVPTGETVIVDLHRPEIEAVPGINTGPRYASKPAPEIRVPAGFEVERKGCGCE
ncbi:MAG TPA: BON domain-containing protein [Planctomycetota bacterium]|jgi:osmotically-inducible protein OsmY